MPGCTESPAVTTTKSVNVKPPLKRVDSSPIPRRPGWQNQTGYQRQLGLRREL